MSAIAILFFVRRSIDHIPYCGTSDIYDEKNIFYILYRRYPGVGVVLCIETGSHQRIFRR